MMDRPPSGGLFAPGPVANQASAAQRINAAPSQALVGLSAMLLAPPNPDRVTITIKNTDRQQSVWLGSGSSLIAGNTGAQAAGHQLGPGEAITLTTQGPIYAVADIAGVVVSLLEETAG